MVKNSYKPFVLVILDGWGEAPENKGNCIKRANPPNFNKIWQNFPHTLLNATGKAVGLEANERSGSEVGHLNLGAGRIVTQDSRYISQSISDGSFFRNPAFQDAIRHVKRHKSKLHLMGLLGDKESTHAHPDHLAALLVLARQSGLNKCFLHLFTDGRDSPQRSAMKYLQWLGEVIERVGIGTIASLGGRYYAMDRIKRWDRLSKAYHAMVHGEGHKAVSPFGVVNEAYKKGLTDEFIVPHIIVDEKGKPLATIGNNDAVIFYNYRSDRARQFTKPFVQGKFDFFERGPRLKNLFFVAMTDFGPDLPVHTAFVSHDVPQTLPFVLSHFRQLYIAETEKFPHISFFFNGGYDHPVAGEERAHIPSPNVAHYDDVPEMSAKEVANYVLSGIKRKKYDFICMNFANPDMVGHTGNIPATIKAIKCVDQHLGRIIREVLKCSGEIIVTADHGNADEKINLKTGEIIPYHSKNPVPCIYVNKRKLHLRKGGVLGNIAPTILELLDIKKPKAMTASSLILKK